MRRGLPFIVAGVGGMLFLLAVNYLFDGAIGFFAGTSGRARAREAMLLLLAAGVVIWGCIAIAFPDIYARVARWSSGRTDELAPKPPVLPVIARGPAIFGKSIRYADPLVGWLRPCSVLLELSVAQRRDPEQARLIKEVFLERTGPAPSWEEKAWLAQMQDEAIRHYQSNADFCRARERLGLAGVSVEFGGQGDACGEFNVLRIAASSTSLPVLESMAADDAGLTTTLERTNVAKAFRHYLWRFDPGWAKDPQRYPMVETSPYLVPLDA